MGTPAYATGTIGFKPDSAAAIDIVKAWIKRANNNEFPKDSEDNGSYDISITDEGRDFIEISAASMRDCNLDWQLERLQNFLQTIDSCISFDAQVYIMGDGFHWERE